MKAWNTVRIDQLGRVVTGKTPSSERPEEFGDAYPFITPSDIPATRKYVEVERHLSERGMESHRRIQLPKKSVCVVCIGATIGKVCMVERLSISNQQINSIIPTKDKSDADFVYYLSTTLRDSLVAFAGGSATPIINKSAFSSIKLLVPEYAEQRKIAAILSAYDEQIENNQRRIALLENMAEEIYREWFVRLRFHGYEKAKFVKGIPQGWRVAELKELASVNPSSISRRNNLESILYVDISSVSTNRIDDVTPYASVDAPGRARRRVKHGDVIWSSVRPANRAYCLIYEPDENLIVSTGFAVIRPNDTTPFTFLFFAVTSNPFVDQMTTVAKGAAYPATSFDDFEKAKLLVPTDDLMKSFHEKAEPMFRQKHFLQQQSERLRKTRDLLLPRLISGKRSVENLAIQFPPSMKEPAHET